MKKKACLFLSFLGAFSIASCSLPSIDWGVSSKSIDVYSLTEEKSAVSKEEYKTMTYNFLIKEKEGLLPYICLEDYVNILEPLKKPGFVSSVSKSNKKLYWEVKDSKDSTVFVSLLDTEEETLTLSGSLSSGYGKSADYSKSSLYLEASFSATYLHKGRGYAIHSYADLGYKPFAHNGSTYFPLSFFDAAYSDSLGIHLFYNFDSLYCFSDYSSLSKAFYADEAGAGVSVFSEMDSIVKSSYKTMPLYLRKDRLSSFYYLFQNLYGLAAVRGISSMKSLIDGSGLPEAFLGEEEEARYEALSKFLCSLDDGHTALSTTSYNPWQSKKYSRFGKLWAERIALRSSLLNQRSKAYEEKEKEEGEVLYSSDGTLAYIPFDHFSFASNAYNSEGEIKQEIYLEDDYFFLKKRLGEIKEKGSVSDVVLDVSINGGGTVGVLMKILALISDDNRAQSPMYLSDIDCVYGRFTSIDSNNDGKKDLDDVYGDDFSFHILTSPYSFSCGNAFPFFAKKNGYADIVGVNSGGGECAVGTFFLPSGEYIGHSSMMRLGWYENETFEGDENGAGVDVSLDYSSYYDLDVVQGAISQ